jgi:hypothetical protein
MMVLKVADASAANQRRADPSSHFCLATKDVCCTKLLRRQGRLILSRQYYLVSTAGHVYPPGEKSVSTVNTCVGDIAVEKAES